MPITRRIVANIGWVERTALGFRLFESRRGRYFRDPVRARARETVLWKKANRRSSAAQRREPYLIGMAHLDWQLPREIRHGAGIPDRTA
jgi:hypothetical protein